MNAPVDALISPTPAEGPRLQARKPQSADVPTRANPQNPKRAAPTRADTREPKKNQKSMEITRHPPWRLAPTRTDPKKRRKRSKTTENHPSERQRPPRTGRVTVSSPGGARPCGSRGEASIECYKMHTKPFPGPGPFLGSDFARSSRGSTCFEESRTSFGLINITFLLELNPELLSKPSRRSPATCLANQNTCPPCS
jgi:hypothetical protein